MRKIEQQMLDAIHTKKAEWRSDNTAVFFENAGNPYGTRSEVYLFGNHIATYWHGDGCNPLEGSNLEVNTATLARWPSNTTKSRLRALGANLTTKKGVLYLDGKAL